MAGLNRGLAPHDLIDKAAEREQHEVAAAAEDHEAMLSAYERGAS